MYKCFIKVYPNTGTTIELYFSIWAYLFGNKIWFCRIWKDYLRHIVEGESYGNNKYEAFRKAKSNLNTSMIKREKRYDELYGHKE